MIIFVALHNSIIYLYFLQAAKDVLNNIAKYVPKNKTSFFIRKLMLSLYNVLTTSTQGSMDNAEIQILLQVGIQILAQTHLFYFILKRESLRSVFTQNDVIVKEKSTSRTFSITTKIKIHCFLVVFHYISIIKIT